MDEIEQVFTEHPLGLQIYDDDVRWANEGIDRGWAEPWRFGTPTMS